MTGPKSQDVRATNIRYVPLALFDALDALADGILLPLGVQNVDDACIPGTLSQRTNRLVNGGITAEEATELAEDAIQPIPVLLEVVFPRVFDDSGALESDRFAGAIPASLVSAIVFRSEKDRQIAGTLEMADIDTEAVSMRIQPELFEVPSVGESGEAHEDVDLIRVDRKSPDGKNEHPGAESAESTDSEEESERDEIVFQRPAERGDRSLRQSGGEELALDLGRETEQAQEPSDKAARGPDEQSQVSIQPGADAASVYRTIDRIVGAVVLTILEAPVEAGEAQWMKRALEELLQAGAHGDVVELLKHAQLLPDTELDRWIIGAVLDSVGGVESEGALEGDLLSNMRSQLNAAMMEPTDEDVASMILERASEYMAARLEMKTRSPSEPVQPGAEAGRALTLFELRARPEDVPSWLPDELNLGWRPYALAIFIAGFAAGYSDLSIWQRGGSELRHIAEAVIADAVNESLGSDVPLYIEAGMIRVTAERSTFRDPLRLAVRHGSTSILSRDLPPLGTRAALLRHGIDDDQLAEDAALLAESFGLARPVTWKTTSTHMDTLDVSSAKTVEVGSHGRKPTVSWTSDPEALSAFLEELCAVNALSVEESLSHMPGQPGGLS